MPEEQALQNDPNFSKSMEIPIIDDGAISLRITIDFQQRSESPVEASAFRGSGGGTLEDKEAGGRELSSGPSSDSEDGDEPSHRSIPRQN